MTQPKTTATRQFAYLALASVNEQDLENLRQRLSEIDEQTTDVMRGNTPSQVDLPFHELTTIHYARFVIIESNGGHMLAFSTNYDGIEGDENCSERVARKLHFAELEKLAGSGLEDVFQYCVGFRRGELNKFLAKHSVKAKTFYVGSRGRSLSQVRWEAELRRDVDAILDSGDWQDKRPEEVRHEVRKKLESKYESIPSFPPQPDREAWGRKVAWVLGLGASAASAAILYITWPPWNPATAKWLWIGVAALVVLVVALLRRFRNKEKTDPQFEPTHDTQTHERFRVASEGENEFLSNQLTHLVELKPGLMRAVVIRVVFFALDVLSRHWFNRGKLGGIPSIHFARWSFIPNRGVLFLSNFDSSWQSYLGDFINQASSGLTAVWSNTVDYPRTEWLLSAGSKDASRFLAWTRYHQIPSQVWYAAYPGISVVNVNANTAIRRGLADHAAMDAATWLFWLRGVDRVGVDAQYHVEAPLQTTVEVAVPPREPLPFDQIQGLILRGYGHKPEARFLLLRLDSQPNDPAVKWLSRLELTSAAVASRVHDMPDPLLNVAISYSGLEALGVHRKLRDGFSTPFVQGSHNCYRARVNGDSGDSAPDKWQWGSEKEPVHVVLLVYASDVKEVDRFAEQYRTEAQSAGFTCVKVLEGTTLHGRKEHFGFRDGIAQPVVRGSGRAERPGNTVNPGEFLLGHEDGYGNTSYSPFLGDFDFGHNGSYLVFRQLAQDVEAFWNFCDEQTEDGATTVASKMVGRWPSGSPLVKNPDEDPQDERVQDDDQFSYLANTKDNDRYGARCPFGSHLRRSNPRDWQLGGSRKESLRISNLHRIIRRGRPYGEPLDKELDPERMIAAARQAGHSENGKVERGLQFLCFNANLERQFEFVQQQWCDNPKFAAGNSDADPLLGPKMAHDVGLAAADFTVQSDVRAGLKKSYTDIQSFVRVVGSTYFFMPSLPALKDLQRAMDESDPWQAAEEYAGGCPFRPGLERHVWPSGDGKGIVTKVSSDAIFGSDGLGFGRTFWTKIISWLARIGIQEQTGSEPGETSIANCVKGWGQGPYSSRVFDAEVGINQKQLDAFIAHLQAIAVEQEIPNQRITQSVLAAFVTTQDAEPYSTWSGVRQAHAFSERAGARFRGHIQWQAFGILCGQVDRDGTRHVTPELIREFFNSEEPFFDRFVDRRRRLQSGDLVAGDRSGILADAPAYVDLVKTDLRYKKRKSGLWMIIKIACYMLMQRKSKVGPLTPG